ncbi:Nicotinamide/nicotinic acid mononucleotide adenylyltransferase, partial [Lachnellula hyalina]
FIIEILHTFEPKISVAEARIDNPESKSYDSQNGNRHAVCCFAAGPEQFPPPTPHITPKRCLENPTRIDSMWLLLPYNLPTLEDVRDGVRVNTVMLTSHSSTNSTTKTSRSWGVISVQVPAKICLLAGADLVQTMSTPGVWSSDDLDHILGMYGACIIEREGTDIDDALSSLQNYKDNIHVVKQLIQNNVSSTKIRLFLRKELSIRYLIPSPVINYIEEHNLYQEDGISSMKEKGNAEATQNSGRTSPAIGSSGSRNHIDKAS